MTVDSAGTAAHAEHHGTSYYFCSANCHDIFVANPAEYTSDSVTPPHR